MADFKYITVNACSLISPKNQPDSKNYEKYFEHSYNSPCFKIPNQSHNK